MILDRVTVTGADDSTDIKAMKRLSKRFPFVEWGILLSQSSGGQSRFPSGNWLASLAQENLGVPLSGHLCGRWVRDACAGNPTFWDEVPFRITGMFNRIQLNFHAITHTIQDARAFTSLLAEQHPEEGYIFQLDDVNNAILGVAQKSEIDAFPLFDLSGGTGVLPESWPRPSASYCGYAGGLSPENLDVQMRLIAQAAEGDARIWIDVETHVRSDNDRVFNIGRVEKFLETAEAWVA